MYRIGLICWFALTSTVLGQYAPSGPFAPNPQGDPRSQRARREFAVAKVGNNEVARSLVETYGDDAIAAIVQCDVETGKRLAEWHNSGEFQRRIGKPRQLLQVIGQPGAGDEVAVFAMKAPELSDPDCLEAFLASPLHYTCAIKKLADGAAEIRARRMQPMDIRVPVSQFFDEYGKLIVIILGAIGILLFVRWFKRRQAESAAA